MSAQTDGSHGGLSLAQAVCQAILRQTNPQPRLIVLYGSAARGEATSESDVDLLVVLERSDPELVAAVRTAVYDAMWDDNFSHLVSTLTLSIAEFERLRRQGYGLVKNIEEEGVTLWRAA